MNAVRSCLGRGARLFALGTLASLLSLGACTNATDADDVSEGEPIAEQKDALITNPSVGGPYGSLTTYKCTGRSTSYCKSWLPLADAIVNEIEVRLNNARVNWGCGSMTDPGGTVTSGRWKGSMWHWYYGASGYYYGCLAIWNVEKQAAYIVLDDPASANNTATYPMHDKYQATGYWDGVLGMPISNPIQKGWTGASVQWFAGGVITGHTSFGARYATNELALDFREQLGLTSPTQFGNTWYALTADETPTRDVIGAQTGVAVTFFDGWWGYRGYIVKQDGGESAHTIYGPIARAWDRKYGFDGLDQGRGNASGLLPYTRGSLGFPTSNLEPYSRVLPSGLELDQQSFEGGAIRHRPSDSWLNTQPRGAPPDCSSGNYVALQCRALNGIYDLTKCNASQPGCSHPTTIYGSRYSNYETETLVTSELPSCASLSIQDSGGYWKACQDGEGRLSNLGVNPAYPSQASTSCQKICTNGTWDTNCMSAAGDYMTCGQYGVYQNSCTTICLGSYGGLFGALGDPSKYYTACTSKTGTQTTCGASGLAINPAIDDTPPPPKCSDVCGPLVSCSGMTCKNDQNELVSCREYSALPCASAADFVNTASGPRFRFTISSPIVTGQSCGGDSDGDCLDNTMEDQLALASAPRIFYDEDESCANGGFNFFDSGIAMAQHCNRVDLFQVRPISGGQALSWSSTGHATTQDVSSWQSDSSVKHVVIRYLMAYPYQIVSGVWPNPWLQSYSHVGDLEWIEVGLESADLRTWVVKNIWLSHHGPVHNADSYGSYAEHMARIARDGTPNREAILNIAADEDSHGSWAIRSATSDDCDKDNDKFVRDCFVENFKTDLIKGRAFYFDASRNIGGSHSGEYLRAGGFPGPAQLVRFQNWQGPGGQGTQTLYTIAYDSGHGTVHEFLIDSADSVAGNDAKAHERFAGWKCANRTSSAHCATAPHESSVANADGDCYLFSARESTLSGAPTTTKANAMSQQEGYCYTLWGAQSRAEFVK